MDEHFDKPYSPRPQIRISVRGIAIICGTVVMVAGYIAAAVIGSHADPSFGLGSMVVVSIAGTVTAGIISCNETNCGVRPHNKD